MLAALLQWHGLPGFVAVLAVYGVGQLLESYVLVPLLVGDRIGLHPLAVIFALLAFGQLFGFAGVLLALPVSAVLLVGAAPPARGLRRFADRIRETPDCPRAAAFSDGDVSSCVFELAPPEPPSFANFLPGAQRRGSSPCCRASSPGTSTRPASCCGARPARARPICCMRRSRRAHERGSRRGGLRSRASCVDAGDDDALAASC